MLARKLLAMVLLLNIFIISVVFAGTNETTDVDTVDTDDSGPCIFCEWPFGTS